MGLKSHTGLPMKVVVTVTNPPAAGWLKHASALVAIPAAVLMGAWVALPAGPRSAMLLLALNAIVVVALVVGIRAYRPSARSAWLTLVGTQLCSIAAFSYWYLIPSITGAVLPVPSRADALFLVLYAGNCVAVGLLIRRENRGHDREVLLDVLIVTVALGALSWAFLIRPYAEAAELSTAVKLISVAYPALDLVLVVLTLRLAFSGSKTTPAKALLLVWGCFQLGGDTAYGVLVLTGDWTLASPVILLWMAAFGCLAAAALRPSMARLGAPSDVRADATGRGRTVVVVGIVLILPIVLSVRLIRGNIEDLQVIAGASVLVFLLALARGHVAGDRSTRKADRTALAKLIVGFVVCALLPLALLAESSVRLAERALVDDARSRVRTTSTVTAELVHQQMEGLAQLVEAYAERQTLTASLGDGSATTFASAAVQRHIAQLQGANPGIVGVFLTDPSGRLGAVVPSTPEIVGKDFSYRDWYKGAIATDGPYVSRAYRTAIRGEGRAVAAASVVRGADGRIVGVLGAVYDLKAIQTFSNELAQAQGVNLQITDQGGTVVSAPGADGLALLDVSTDPGVAAALRGEERLLSADDAAGQETLSAYAPVPDIGWTVTARVPTATAFASLIPLRSTVYGIAVLLGQILLGGLVLMARGQRQRREAERSVLEREESTRGILEAAADAFVAIDTNGTVATWSPQAEALFGWTSDQAEGRSLAELIVPPELRQRHTEGLARLARTGKGTILGQRIELPALHRDGHEFPVELVIWQSTTNGNASFNAFVHDISDRRQHETALAAARDEALEASQMKTEFLAVMSHELRTPMNGVMGMTSLLLATPLTTEQRDYAETVRASADSLLGLLNDVLDLSKVEADRLELELLDFELRPVIRDVVHLLVVGAQEKGVVLEADIAEGVAPVLRGDPTRLRQVLLNLVGNALKFTSSGSVRLLVLPDPSASAGDPDRVRLRFEVVDTGIGIAAEARDGLFEAFSQADASTTRQYGGTGLGLTISKRLVALFGGEIGVDSELGVGSTFWFTAGFLIGTPHAVPAVGTAFIPRAPRSGPGLVLVVDDNSTNRKIAVRMLETLGHRADVAVTGLDAVECCARTPYDLVLMDCRMPVMDGYEATRTIRATENAAEHLPIVAMTASAMYADRQRCLAVGMDDYLSKPVRLEELAEKVDHWLQPGAPPVPGVVPQPAAASEPQSAAAPAVLAPIPAPPVLAPAVGAAAVAAAAVAGAAVAGAAAVAGPAVPAPTSDLPVLDEAIVAGLRSLGADFLAGLIPVFVLAAPDRLAAVRTAVVAADAGALSAAAHALGGSAANMGGARVAAVCRRLEEAAGAGRLDDAPADLVELETELLRMLAAASTLIHIPA